MHLMLGYTENPKPASFKAFTFLKKKKKKKKKKKITRLTYKKYGTQ